MRDTSAGAGHQEYSSRIPSRTVLERTQRTAAQTKQPMHSKKKGRTAQGQLNGLKEVGLSATYVDICRLSRCWTQHARGLHSIMILAAGCTQVQSRIRASSSRVKDGGEESPEYCVVRAVVGGLNTRRKGIIFSGMFVGAGVALQPDYLHPQI